MMVHHIINPWLIFYYSIYPPFFKPIDILDLIPFSFLLNSVLSKVSYSRFSGDLPIDFLRSP